MKPILKIFFFLLLISFVFTGVSCSKKSHGYRYSSGSSGGSTSYNPVATKSQPVRKKYIISGKRKRILGQEDPKSN